MWSGVGSSDENVVPHVVACCLYLELSRLQLFHGELVVNQVVFNGTLPVGSYTNL